MRSLDTDSSRDSGSRLRPAAAHYVSPQTVGRLNRVRLVGRNRRTDRRRFARAPAATRSGAGRRDTGTRTRRSHCSRPCGGSGQDTPSSARRARRFIEESMMEEKKPLATCSS